MAAFRPQPTWLQNAFRRHTFLCLLALSVITGCLTGLVGAKAIGLTDEAKQVSHLQDYKPDAISRVIADDGKTVVGEFALERRIPLQPEEIPERLKQAFLAIEDTRFYQHVGIDPIRLTTAVVRNLTPGRRLEGASTITQQLARNLFLSMEQTWTRKIREALISMEIERHYTKEQILAMYCNQINLGSGAYGVEAAAQLYFGKTVKDLTLPEMATLAAIPKSPTYYSPLVRPEESLKRRNLVIEFMADAGYITAADAASAKAEPLNLARKPKVTNNDLPYAYFVEEIRKELEHSAVADKYNIHQDGLNVYTTIDANLQKYAEKAIRKGLHMYDRRHRRWRGNLVNVIDTEGVKNLDNYQHPDWLNKPEQDEFLAGLVLAVSPKGAEARMGEYKFLLTEKETGWVGKSPTALFKRGDLVVVQVKQIDDKAKTLTVTLEQMPAVQGALVAIDAKTGEVKAMVGGYDFNTEKFNNATQANRQTGSVFKPFVYTTAIENGFMPDDVLIDAPYTKGTWAPQNYDKSFKGPIALRSALAQSRNIPAVRLLEEVGVQRGVKMVQRFGLPNPMAPYLSSALGATEEPLLAMVSAYTAFPNRGFRMEPHYIKKIADRYGQPIYEWEEKSTRVISPYVAGQMIDLLEGVVKGGTATAIGGYSELHKWPIAGKTGTVDDFTDAWFIGFTPELTAGVWIGYSSEKRSLGNGEAGGVAALPMWIDFMRPVLKNRKPVSFDKKAGIDEEVRVAQGKQRKANAERLAKAAAIMSEEELSDSAKQAIKGAAGGGGDIRKKPEESRPAKPNAPRKPVLSTGKPAETPKKNTDKSRPFINVPSLKQPRPRQP